MVFCGVGSADDRNLVTSSVATTAGSARVASPNGQCWSRGSICLGAYPNIPLPSAGSTTTLVVYGNNAVGASNGRLWVENVSGTTFLINDSGGRPWVRLNGSDVFHPGTGPQVSNSSKRAAVYRVVSATYCDAWWDGAQQQYGTISASIPASLSVNYWGGAAGEGAGDIALLAHWNIELPDAYVQSLTLNPWQIFEPRRIFVPKAVAGAGSHATSGTLSNAGATVAGTSAHLTLHATTGALAPAGAVVVGASAHEHATTGTLANAGATVAGTAAHAVLHATSGALGTAGATVAGASAHEHATTGALANAGATVAGSAARTAAGAHATSAALANSGGTIAGTAAHLTLHTTTGALGNAGGTVAGTATRLALHTTIGALAADGAYVAGTAAHPTAHSASGVLSAPGAIIVGTASRQAATSNVWGYTLSNGLTAEETLVAIHAMLSTGVIAADVRKVNGFLIKGSGVQGDTWGPA